MGFERDTHNDVDDMTVSVTSYLLDGQSPSGDDDDSRGDGHAVMRETAQVTSHGRVVSCSVHDRPVSIRGESARARIMAAMLTQAQDAKREELEEKEDERRMAR